ncbi:MAG: CDP-diacylglycerol--glycerol-3-phosphate 3-phosphatidyltransferase [Bordetella sp.]|nr:MAG: CDP-diacylglycerol--glycerol-3-phosphate 3-phosphatidyltransferase [Bordetella sp.]
MSINVPTILTWFRITMIPLVISLFYLPENWFGIILRDTWIAMVFMFSALTDWLDGWLARRWKQTSAFGAFLDPVADKLMVCSALLILLNLNRIDTLIALIIVGREIIISSLRAWMAQIGANNNVRVHRLGKLKTILQMIAIPCLFFDKKFDGQLYCLGSGLITLAAILAVWSMLYYLQRAWFVIKN